MGKRRTKGTGGVRARPNGRFELKWQDAQGKWCYKTVQAKNKTEAGKLVAALAAETQQTKKTWEAGYPFKDYCDHWIKTTQGLISKRTLEGYIDIIENHLKPAFGDDLIHLISTAAVNDYRIGKSKGLDIPTKAGSKLSPRTIRHHLILFGQIMEHAKKSGYISSNPVRDAALPKVDQAQREFLTKAESNRLIKATPEKDKALIMTFLMTGARAGEILALRWSDLNGNKLTIQRSLKREDGKLVEGAPKTKNAIRTITLPDKLVKQLAKHKKAQKNNPKNLIFPSERGSYLSVDNLRNRTFKTAKKKAKIIKHITLHDLRHTHAALCIDQNMNPKVLSSRLGHASVAFTLDTYGGLYTDTDNQAIEVL